MIMQMVIGTTRMSILVEYIFFLISPVNAYALLNIVTLAVNALSRCVFPYKYMFL
jgi:hypothetical protein